ncbi:MAG TPA: helix-hairpin-helix domain-containing protein [Thermoleophilaceae bacterium]|jgi:competence protein ComEA
MTAERSRAEIAAWIAAAVVLLFLAWKLLAPPGGGGGGPPVAVSHPASGERSPAAGRAVYVHVAGRVRRPGLYRLAAGARIATAIDRAGGPAGGADLSAVNLAMKVQDGQQVLVPKRGAAPAVGSAGSAADASGGGARISLATATVEQLDGLDGIGPTLAKRIVEYRDKHGGFRSVDELKQVDGIGEKRFEALKDSVGP